MIALRAGYRSDTTNGLSALQVVYHRVGTDVWGTEVAYACAAAGRSGEHGIISRF